MSRFVCRALLVFCSSVLIAGCGDDGNPTLPTPGPGLPPEITDLFAGDINRNGAVTHTFLAEASGVVTAILDTLSPEDVTAIGLSLGTWNGTACQIVIANDNAAQGARVIGSATMASNLCVRVYDVGKISSLASYQVTVIHP